MSPIRERWSAAGRWCLAVLIVGVASFVMLLGTLRTDRLNVDVGPGDADYAQGLSDFWRYDGERTWREMRRRARVHLPVTVEGPGQLSLSVAQPESQPIRLRVEFDDGTVREITVAPSREFQELHLELPETRVRGDVRLRTDTEGGAPGRLRIDGVAWSGSMARPQARLAGQSAVLTVLSLLALGAAGVSLRTSVAGSLFVGAAVTALSLQDPFVTIHLVRRGAVAAMLGLVLVLVLRLLARRLTPTFLSLVYGAFLLKAFLVLHPDFYFTDLPIHETLLELVYHRGVVDFWTRLPEYQAAHNLGVAPVAGVYQAFPYPAAFYLVAHLGNSAYHAPELWLKLGGALFSALALLPLGFLARRLSPEHHVDVAAGLVYLLTPALTRSLLLLGAFGLAGPPHGSRRHRLSGGHLTGARSRSPGGSGRRSHRDKPRRLYRRIHPSGSLRGMSSRPRADARGIGSFRCRPFGGGRSRRRRRCARDVPPRYRLERLARRPPGRSRGFDGGRDSPDLAHRLRQRPRPTVPGRAPARPGHARAGFLLLKRVSEQSEWALRLLLAAWALSGAIAYSLRYYFLDLFHFQKELYWVGALLAVATGVMAAGLARKGRIGSLAAAAIFLVIALGGFLAFSEMAPRFYDRYAFL